MKKNMPESILTDTLGIILLSHGAFVAGIVQSLNMILGETENVAYLYLEEGDDVEQFGGEIAKTIEAFPKGCIVLIDMMAGTPLNQFVMNNATPDRSKAVCGLNLNMLLDVVSSRDDSTLEELVALAVESGRAGVVDVEAKLKEKRSKKQ